eukprot:Skav211468  [mRNA]  locus=scaffold379:328634:332028:- [translate_table: standard]
MQAWRHSSCTDVAQSRCEHQRCNTGPQWTALAEAVNAKNTTLCTWLLSKGASPDIEDRRTRTPLYHAVYFKMTDLVSEMLKTAKNFGTRDGDGVDLLTRAVFNEDLATTKLLMEKGITSERAVDAARQAPYSISQLFGYTTAPPVVATPVIATPTAAPATAPATAPAVAPATAPPPRRPPPRPHPRLLQQRRSLHQSLE